MSSSIKYILLFLAILAVVVVGLYVLHKKNASPAQTPATTEVEQKKLTKTTDAVTVNVTPPQIPGGTQDIVDANVFLVDEIGKRIASFEIDAEDNMKSMIDLPADIKSTVTGSPAIEEKNSRFVSIFMGMEWYLRGSAHPSHSIDTYVYDYEQKRLVEVPQFFRGGSDYLKVLSTLSKEDLFLQSKQGDMGFMYDESMVTDGTAPKPENFSKILPTKDGLVIYFDEYQVAPYAAGPQQVVIPYAKLKDIINPQGVVGMYIQ